MQGKMWIMTPGAFEANCIKPLAIMYLFDFGGVMASSAESVLFGHKQVGHRARVRNMALRAIILCEWRMLVCRPGGVGQILVTGHADHGAVEEPNHALEV
jgi:hypothetical protein